MSNEKYQIGQGIVKVAVNVCVIREGTILLGKRIGKLGYGTWCVPGGKFEYGESLVDAAKRELLEETGIVADDIEHCYTINEPLPHCHFIHFGFRAVKWHGEPRVTEPDKFAEWRFFDLNDLPSPLWEGTVPQIAALKKGETFVDYPSIH